MINTPERPYLKWLKDGIKTAEGRVNSEKYQKIKIGDEIIFIDTKSDDFIKGFVIFKHEYETFEEMLKAEGIKNMLPFLNDANLEKGIQVYTNFNLPIHTQLPRISCQIFRMNLRFFALNEPKNVRSDLNQANMEADIPACIRLFRSLPLFSEIYGSRRCP